MDNKVYFANLPEDQIGMELYSKVTQFYDEIAQNGQLMMWNAAHRYYFSLDDRGRHEATAIQEGGEQGELSILKANHYRNLLQHLLVLVTQQRPAFECRAVNTDYKSQLQTILGKNILEYYLREQRLDGTFRQVAEYAIVYSEAYVEVDWDEDKGDEVAVDPETGEILHTGDVEVRVYEPRDVIRRCWTTDDKKQSWYILRRYAGRHDLAAKYPKVADQIIGYGDDSNVAGRYYEAYLQSGKQSDDNELVAIYTFYHDKTPACPLGKKVTFLGNDVVLDYGPLNAPELPVYPMIPSRRHGTSFGYSVSFDLLCVQEALDLLYSTILSNQATFGVQNIWMKPGSNLSPTSLGGGLNILESAEKPEPINLTNTPQEIFNFLKGLEDLGEVLSGVNSVARGQPEASLKSGSALALVASQAVQFSNGLQASYTNMLEDTGSAILRRLQTHATLPRSAMIAGKNNKTYMKDFSAKDIGDISRAIVDIGNPVSRTVAGRVEMATQLLQNQMIKRPEQYIQVMETGNLDPIIEDAKRKELLIEAENEALREGKPVMAIFVDDHLDHINCHKYVLAGPEERLDKDLAMRVQMHIQEHVNLLRTIDPGLLNALGQQSIAPQQNGMPQPPQGANAPQPNAQPQEPEQAGTAPPGQQVVPPTGSPPDVAANMPNMPAQPNITNVPGATPAA